MRGKHRKHLHVHAKCGFCDWEKCPGDLEPVAMSGFYVVHMIDDHWDFVQRIHDSTGDMSARKRLLRWAQAEMLS